MERSWRSKADLRIAGFKLWVDGRDFPTSADARGGDRLRIAVRCSDSGAHRVDATDVVLDMTAMDEFLQDCEAMNRSLEGAASFTSTDGRMRADLVMKSRGRVDVTVRIAPGQPMESRSYAWDIDQSYLAEIISSLRKVLRSYEPGASQGAV